MCGPALPLSWITFFFSRFVDPIAQAVPAPGGWAKRPAKAALVPVHYTVPAATAPMVHTAPMVSVYCSVPQPAPVPVPVPAPVPGPGKLPPGPFTGLRPVAPAVVAAPAAEAEAEAPAVEMA